MLIIYALSFGVIILIELIINLFGFGIQLDAGLIAYYIFFIIGIFFVILSAFISTENLVQQLYPSKAHLRSVFYDLAVYEKGRLIKYSIIALFFLAGLGAIVLLTNSGFTDWWFNLLLLTYLFFVSLSPGVMEDDLDKKFPKTLKAFSKLFELKGYKIIQSPITDNPRFDPLLAGLDFYGTNKEYDLAIAVRPNKSEPADKWQPYDLLRSTRALKTYFRTKEYVKQIIPVIIFIAKGNETWQKKGIKIIRIPKQVLVNKILNSDNQKELKKISDQYLRISQKDIVSGSSRDELQFLGGEE
ncbi:MAG: hypothetical protein NWF10_05190 [Candidatus Bathyarchaeota archaeon]|nr:hypothetical protein [Candidatus Bathyarchaeota archaeon]